MQPVVIEEQFALPCSQQEAFTLIASIEGMLLFEGFGMIPGIRAVRTVGEVRNVGVEETIVNTDGSMHREAILVHEYPHRYGIRIEGFTSPMGRMVEHIEEHWDITATEQGCTIHRQFTLFPSDGWWIDLLLRRLFAPQFQRAMRKHHRRLANRFAGIQSVTADDRVGSTSPSR